jgi:hypothetical protein
VYTQDYDDGGWVNGALVQTPITMTIQSPYRDLGRPHNPKQWNMLETDVNTQGQTMQTTLLFEDGATTVALAGSSSTARTKIQLQVNAGNGQQAYRASVKHTIAVTKAPTLYQEDIHAEVISPYDSSFDTYWMKPGGDYSVFVKQGYFDYTSNAVITVNLYADQATTPYFTFTLPTLNKRNVQRVRFGNVNPGAPAFNCRQWRAIGTSAGSFQFWEKPVIEFKPIGSNSYQKVQLTW